MTVQRYDVGDMVRITLAFTNDALAATDPTEAILTIMRPDETTLVYRWPTPGVGESQLTKDSTGNFHTDYELVDSGIVRFRREGTGAVTSAEEGYFFVRDSAFD